MVTILQHGLYADISRYVDRYIFPVEKEQKEVFLLLSTRVRYTITSTTTTTTTTDAAAAAAITATAATTLTSYNIKKRVFQSAPNLVSETKIYNTITTITKHGSIFFKVGYLFEK